MKTRTMNLGTLAAVTVLTVVAVTITVAIIASMVMPEPVAVANTLCPPGFHEEAEYDEAGEWTVFSCDRIKRK